MRTNNDKAKVTEFLSKRTAITSRLALRTYTELVFDKHSRY